MIKNFALAALAAVALTAGGQAAAAYLTFSGIDGNGNANTQVAPTNSNAARAQFFSNLVGVGTQDFESFAVGANAAAISPISFGSAGTATFTGNGEVAENLAEQTNGFGRYSVPGGTRYWETNAGTGDFELSFSTPIAAFGFYGIDMGDFQGTLRLEFYNAANVLLSTQPITTAPEAQADGSILFFGIIAGTAAEEFSRIRFLSTGGSDVFAFDSFSIGTREQVVGIPEPASLALVGVALLGLGLARRKSA